MSELMVDIQPLYCTTRLETGNIPAMHWTGNWTFIKSSDSNYAFLLGCRPVSPYINEQWDIISLLKNLLR